MADGITNRINAASKNTTMGYVERAQKAREKNSARLASGKRAANAAADPSAMAIVEKMIGQINGLNQAWRNVQDGVSMMRTAEGAMSGIGDITSRISEMTIQAANGVYTDHEREAMQLEVDQLVEEVNAMAKGTEFNAKKLLDGSLSEENGGLWIQAGANEGQGMNMSIRSLLADDLGISDISFAGKNEAEISARIEDARNALSAVTEERARMGAYINRMEYASQALGTMSVNLEASKSRIDDADMARAVMDNAKAGILNQASIRMLGKIMKESYSMSNMLLSVMGR